MLVVPSWGSVRSVILSEQFANADTHHGSAPELEFLESRIRVRIFVVARIGYGLKLRAELPVIDKGYLVR